MKIRTVLAIVILLGTIGYLTTALKVVAQDEVGIVRRFGKALSEPMPPGLHLGFPWGMDRVDRLKRDQARTINVGASRLESAPLTRAPDPSGDDFLTGDLNLVTAQAQVQFLVVEPRKYLFTSRSADGSLIALAESALTRALAARGIDDVLTTGRAEVAERMRLEIQGEADRQSIGVSIRAVRLGRVAPPTQVAPAFDDASRARSDKRQAVTKAEEYRDRARAEAKGQAREIADRASAAFEAKIQAARGNADSFKKLLAVVRKNPRAAKHRLYLETLSELLPKFRRKVVVPSGENIDLSLFLDK